MISIKWKNPKENITKSTLIVKIRLFFEIFNSRHFLKTEGEQKMILESW